MNKQAELFFNKAKQWNEAFQLLRSIILENKSLVEDYKWMHPCYTFEEKNIVLIHGFKNYCAILFHKGALLPDPQKLLIQQTENVQSARQIRFTSIEQIKLLTPAIKAYIIEAVKVEMEGKKVAMKKVADYPIPKELQHIFTDDSNFNKAFYALTPGRQKAYLFYFNQAIQTKTRLARIQKYYQHILNGKGLDD